jgi:glycine betaine/proline transport system permease protein
MDWLTDYKIPSARCAKTVFDWMNDNLTAVRRHLGSPGMDDRRHPVGAADPASLVIIALFVALTWFCSGLEGAAWCWLGFLFILNQGYWEETTESLTLILSACVVCMGIGRADRHRRGAPAPLYRAMVPSLT